MSEQKENCKYWDKCYQKNPLHIAKYNHPPKLTESESVGASENLQNEKESEEKPQLTMSSTSSCDNNPKRSLSPKIQEQPEDYSTKRSKKSPSSTGESSDNKNLTEQESAKEEITVSETKEENVNENNEPSLGRTAAEEREELDITEEYNEVMRNLEGKNYFEIFQRRVRYSQKAEYLDLLKTPEFIRHKFLVEMPEEFYTFWVFCTSLAKDGQKPEKVFDVFGLKLVGAFEYLCGHFDKAKIQEPGDYLRHWRFFYDPPEFQTVLVKKNTGIHYGYWRDDPKDKEKLLMARNDSKKNCEFEFVGGNCFETIMYFLEKDFSGTPFNRSEVAKMKKTIQDFTQEHQIPLDSLEEMKKERNKFVVTKLFHTAGLVVPFDRKTQVGYRVLLESDNNLKKILERFEKAKGDKDLIAAGMEKLQPIITAANIAVDECDFGTSIELGIDLFCSGHTELHDLISSLLIPGYSMLKRPQFIAIAKAHLENRRKDIKLSIFDLE